MTVSATEVDDAQIAYRATGLLGEFNRAGVLGVADVHAAQAISRIGQDRRETVALAVALAVRALRAGSVCIDLRTVADAVYADTAADEPGEQLDVSELAWPDPEQWLADLQDSPLVAGEDEPDGRPLRMAGGLLYLERYWRQEETVRTQLQQRAAAAPPMIDRDRLRAGLARIFDSRGLAAGEPDLQRRAAAVSVLRWVSVLAGGPGTGKTTTVAKLLALLHDQHHAGSSGRLGVDHGPDEDGPADHGAVGPGADDHDASDQPDHPATEGRSGRPRRPLRVALAAPTGKAAARLEEAVRQATRELPVQDRERIGDLRASTLHRLLGWTPEGKNRFRHNSFNRLPYEVVVVDEMSMVPLTLMARLLEALRPDARLILVGDPDQLASVEAGAVLADIVNAGARSDDDLVGELSALLPDPPERATSLGVVRLQHTWRFGGAIDELARAIRASDPDRVMEVLRSGDPALVFSEPVADPAVAGDAAIDPATLAQLRSQIVEPARVIKEAAESGDVRTALAALERHRLLCAHRRGPYGVTRWTREILRWLGDAIPGYAAAGEWYPGRPLLITNNDYETSLYNGDTGVVIQTRNGMRAAFARGGEPTMIAPVRLDSVQSVHAMTVHRAQGSQFRTVSFIVPPPDSPLLTRELLYTAVTRAGEKVLVLGTEEAIRRATLRPANRASGLRHRL